MTSGQADPFLSPEAWDDEDARMWAEVLEQRAVNPTQVELRARLVAAAGIGSGSTVVEVGCGTGALLADMALVVGPKGRAMGFEPQPVFGDLARSRLEACGAEAWASVEAAVAERLPVADGAADACVAQTVLVHVPGAAQAVAEMCRVVRPGGRVVSIDQDGDTFVVDHPDKELTRRLVAFSSDQRFADGWTGRRLPRLFREAGLVDVSAEVGVHIDTEPGSFLHEVWLRLAEMASEVGVISAAEYERWTQDLAALAEAGSFFASSNYYLCSGRKS